MAEISVLVPVYNVEQYLRKCLDSILNQTFDDMEIICMDDGSTDGSGHILDEYAEKDSRLRVVHKPNSGYGSTMNQALSLAEGKYIGIVESDDYISHDMYEKLHEVMERHNLDFVKTDFYHLWDCEDNTERLDYCRLTDHTEMYGCVIEPNKELEAYYLEKFTWNALYLKSFLMGNQIRYNETPGASYQDNGFWFQTFYYAKRAMFLNQAFYRYKQDNPASSFQSDSKIYAMKNEYDFIHNFLENHGETRRKLFEICFHFRMDGYLFTLSMLANQYKLELAEVIKKECELYEQRKEADFTRMPESKMRILQHIRENPEEYVGRQIKKNEKIYNMLKKYRHIIIYGAGSYGHSVYAQIRRNLEPGTVIDFAVTFLNGEKRYCYSSKVKEITEFSQEKNNSQVIIAVKKNSKAYLEMVECLKELQFCNVMDYEELMG